MKRFFYSKHEQQFGPLSLEELKYENIDRETLVWTEGMEEWDAASNVEDLSEFLQYLPPALPLVESKNQLYLLAVLNLVCIACCFLAFIDIRSVLFTGPAVSVLSLFGYYMARYDGWRQKIVILIPLIISLVCYALMLIGNYSQSEAVFPIGSVIVAGTLLMLVFSADQLKGLRAGQD